MGGASRENPGAVPGSESVVEGGDEDYGRAS